MSLKDIRARIDAIDAEILKLFSDRMLLAKEARAYKKKTYDPGREAEIIRKLRLAGKDSLDGDFIEEVYRQIFAEAKRLQDISHRP